MICRKRHTFTRMVLSYSNIPKWMLGHIEQLPY